MPRIPILAPLLTGALALVALAILLVPSDAYAWGPLAHLHFSAQALNQIAAAPPPVRLLLADFAHEFLYGSLAADIVVGKNLAKYVYHCHNWRVGFNLHRTARPGAEQAFALGFLAHLAADTVAHNYFVPYKTVGSFHRLRAGHAYWELRYDQRMDRGLVRLARHVSLPAFREHDDFLRRSLRRSSFLPFGVTRQLFGSLLASARSHSFQRLSRMALAPDRKLALEDDLVEETNRLAVGAIVGLLREGEGCAAAHADATGSRNLRSAADLRRRLFARAGTRALSVSDAHAIARETRQSFRAAIQGPLDLPASAVRIAA
jgi:hypothetical protein